MSRNGRQEAAAVGGGVLSEDPRRTLATQAHTLFAGRLRTALCVALAILGLFALLDLRLQPALVGPLMLLKLLVAAAIVAAFPLLRHRPSWAPPQRIAVLVVGLIYVVAAASALLIRDDPTTPCFLVVACALTTATFLPWGTRAQLVSVVVAVLALASYFLLSPQRFDVELAYAIVAVILACAGSVYVAHEHERYRRERDRAAILLAEQTRVLERIARAAPLADVLSAVTLLIEEQAPGMLCSVLLLEGDRLRMGAAPSLPEPYGRALDGIVIGPRAGACGTAAYTRAPAVVADIASDPRWAGLRDLALGHGLRACWSAPILTTDGACLGTFSMYCREPRSPAAEHWSLIAVATHLAGLAIGRHHVTAALARSTSRLAKESRLSGALVRVGQELISTLDTPRILERLCHLTTTLLECEVSATVLWQPGEDVYVVSSSHGFAPDEQESLSTLRLPPGALTDLLAALERAPVVQLRSASATDPVVATLLSRHRVTVSLHVALRRGEELIGLLCAGYREREAPFSSLQRRIALGIAQLAAMALENARLVEELERASQLKSEFVSTMSHELRTPLSVILGYTDILHDELDQDEHIRTLGRIRRSGLELLELIEATLDLSRIEAGKDPAQLAPLSVRGLLDELSVEFGALPRRPEVELRWEPVEEVEIRTDRRKLKIILKNLVSNALKFTTTGSVSVSCRAEEARYAFSVRDTGIGIAPHHLPVIFEMFRQADSSDRRSYAGVGLGLYIVHRLLEQLGGTIAVESELGRGSTFTVTFPRLPARKLLSAHA